MLESERGFILSLNRYSMHDSNNDQDSSIKIQYSQVFFSNFFCSPVDVASFLSIRLILLPHKYHYRENQNE